MYKLELNNEEFFELRGLLEDCKAFQRRSYSPRWTENKEALLMKLICAHADAQEEAEREAQAERYAQNAHSMPEGL